jgi:hypothetical protein
MDTKLHLEIFRFALGDQDYYWVKGSVGDRCSITEPGMGKRAHQKAYKLISAMHTLLGTIGFDVTVDYKLKSVDEYPANVPYYKY